MRFRARVLLVAILFGLRVVPAARAGQAPVPTPPDTIVREPSGKVTIRAVRITSPLGIDGRLDESVYTEVPPMTDFIQTEPQEGAPATERTEVWVFFDNDNLYVTARCWESQPERMVVNEMRRDNSNIMENENFAFILDTFYDHRNGFMFIANPIGAKTDSQVTNERQYSKDWNQIWDVKAARFDKGWAVEFAIPFKSLRYRPGREQIWGFNARRVDRWKNELSHLTLIPNAMGTTGLWHTSLAATMVGLEVPAGSRRLDVKPYVTSKVATDLTAAPKISNDFQADAGLDAKYGVTQNLTADFTYNTDFAQVESDEQQVNLTRFSLFFPEKRDFFLENQGMFAFGTVATPSGSTGDVPILFYSRRVGLAQIGPNQWREVPIDVGGRFTGRIGRFNVGAVNIQTADERVSGARRTNFSVVRLKRDILRRSSVGLILTGRSVGQNGADTNAAYGVDGTFAFFNNLSFNTYWARTETDGLSGDNASYRAQLDYAGDRYGFRIQRLAVGDHFNPEIGYVRRSDMRQTDGVLRFSPRPRSSTVVRRYSWTGSAKYVENDAGRVETRDFDGELAIEFQTSDRLTVGYNDSHELVPRAFRVGPGVTIPVGAYDFTTTRVGFNVGQQRPIFGNVLAEHGAFYNGDRTAVSVSAARVNFSSQLSIEPTYSVNLVDLPQRSFTSQLVGSRVIYTMSPLMFTTALLQYSSDNHSVSANVRLRWEYRPGSELFVVFNEERNTLARGLPDLSNRAFIVKINRLLRF